MGVLASAVAHARHGLLFDSLLGLTGAVAAGLVFGALLGYRAQELITNSVIASLGAGGKFSGNGTFKGPSKACPPGGTN